MRKILTVFILLGLTFLNVGAYEFDGENIKFNQEEEKGIKELFEILKSNYADNFEIYQ